MSTLMQQLPEEIKRLEAKHGSDNPYVKQLKEQLRGMQQNGDKSTQDVFRMQAVQFDPPSSETEELEQGKLRLARMRHQNAQLKKR